MKYISPSLFYRLYRYGTGCRIAMDGFLSLPEQTAFGTDVKIRAGYRLDIPVPAENGSPRIVIGNRCDCSNFLTISAINRVELKDNVMTGPHVFITDARQVWEKEGSSVSTVVIGENSWIGAHSSILGNVKIGTGCVVGAGSVVLRDIPDYCVVAGNPAEFRRIYDPSSGDWVRVNSETEARELLDRRRKDPLLSICLTVHDQTEELRRCLESIYTQIGDDGLIEVCVLDDSAAEETEEATCYYRSQHTNFRYIRNSASASDNSLFLQAVSMARGRFVMLHNSETCLAEGSLLPFLNVLHTHMDCAFVLMEHMHIPSAPQTERLKGLSDYLKHTAAQPPVQYPFVLNRREWEQLIGSFQPGELDPWVHLHYALLKTNPHFCLCRYKLSE
ncbi:glycosyltransferase [Paenibacillus sp. FSL R7-0302]|uniref:glycosyltransferase n=1 Tax=Paenibacillus sp. FSL R7-0302 TaxID=2921681 RepID=UPI0030F87FF3